MALVSCITSLRVRAAVATFSGLRMISNSLFSPVFLVWISTLCSAFIVRILSPFLPMTLAVIAHVVVLVREEISLSRSCMSFSPVLMISSCSVSTRVVSLSCCRVLKIYSAMVLADLSVRCRPSGLIWFLNVVIISLELRLWRSACSSLIISVSGGSTTAVAWALLMSCVTSLCSWLTCWRDVPLFRSFVLARRMMMPPLISCWLSSPG